MKQFLFSVSAVALLWLCGPVAYAQEASTSAGGDATGSGGSVAYSVGQVVYTTNTGTTGSVAQGVQQTYKISSVGLDHPSINLKLAAYPNPTTDYLILEVQGDEAPKLTYQLLDLNGKVLGNSKLTGTQTNIDMGSLLPASYFVKVYQGNTVVKTFTVIKQVN